MNDLNIPNTKIESIRNKVAELSAHGLNACEIQKDINKITKPELIQVIMDLIENPPPGNEGSTKDPKLSDAQTGTILFALRYLEANLSHSDYKESDHMAGLDHLNEFDINKLCENLNLDRIIL